jgi:hypothetical protein
MDAEIGARNLADSFRYNYLPRIVKALGHVKTTEELNDLPNHERLALLVTIPIPCQCVKADGTSHSQWHRLSLITQFAAHLEMLVWQCRTLSARLLRTVSSTMIMNSSMASDYRQTRIGSRLLKAPSSRSGIVAAHPTISLSR